MATYNNYDSVTLDTGTILTHPIIAVGSFCVLQFEGTSLQAGEQRTITVGTNSVTIVLNRYGKAEVSLMPFMRSDMADNNVLDNPCKSPCGWRGSLTVLVSEAGTLDTEETLTIYYIMADCPPRLNPLTDVWRTYSMDTVAYNVCAVDLTSHYTSGIPTSLVLFKSLWENPNSWVTPPEHDDTLTFDVMQVLSDKLVTGDVGYHFTTDKRTENVVLVRWIDTYGNLNSRKFTIGGEAYAGTIGDTYARPHSTKVIVNSSYDYGSDEWANITPQRTITFGDDGIPMGQWEWLNTLATSQCIEVYKDGLWHRCNITDGSMERDPRKTTFSVSFTLSVPTAENMRM